MLSRTSSTSVMADNIRRSAQEILQCLRESEMQQLFTSFGNQQRNAGSSSTVGRVPSTVGRVPSTVGRAPSTVGRAPSEASTSCSSNPPDSAAPAGPPATMSLIPSTSAPAPAMRAAFMRSRHDSKRRKLKPHVKANPSGPFYRDVLLLPGPTIKKVPRQAAKVWLAGKGHLKNMVQLHKEQAATDVMLALRGLFVDKLPCNVSVEICQALFTSISPLLVPSGQELTGFIVSKVIKHDRMIYLKPDVLLPGMSDRFPESAVLCADKPCSDESDDDQAFPTIFPHKENAHSASTESSVEQDTGARSRPTEGTISLGEEREDVILVPDDKSSAGIGTISLVEEEEEVLVVRERNTESIMERSPEQDMEMLDDSTTTGVRAVSRPSEVPVKQSPDIMKSSDLLEDILSSLRQSVDVSRVSNKINVFRDNVWEGAVMGFRRKKFDMHAPLSVVFFHHSMKNSEDQAEGAIDLGGPKRELFTLCFKAMVQGPCFVGGDKKLLTRDAAALNNREYFVCGRILALSLIHNGPAPHFLSPVLFKAITDGPSATRVTVDDLPDSEVKNSMLQLRDVERIDQFLEELDKLEHKALATTIDNGGTFPHAASSVGHILQDTAHYYVLGRTLDAFEQFKDGLSTLGVLEAVKQHPSTFQPLFTLSADPLTMQQMTDLFRIVRSSEPARFAVESRVLCNWQQFLQRIEDDDCEANFEDVLMFATGARNLPPLGYDDLSIEFEHERSIFNRVMSPFPLANTCNLVLTLPTIHTSYMSFETKMTYAVMNAQEGFGFA